MKNKSVLSKAISKMNRITGKYCGNTLKNGKMYHIYISGKHFCLVDHDKFVRHISINELKKLSIKSPDGNIIFNKDGYIGPVRRDNV